MRISDWSSDVCSSDLQSHEDGAPTAKRRSSATMRPAAPSIRNWPIGPRLLLGGFVASCEKQLHRPGRDSFRRSAETLAGGYQNDRAVARIRRAPLDEREAHRSRSAVPPHQRAPEPLRGAGADQRFGRLYEGMVRPHETKRVKK